jgi:hypothetical protein
VSEICVNLICLLRTKTVDPKGVQFEYVSLNNIAMFKISNKLLLRSVLLVWFMVFNATFNNISVIPWWSVLLMEETRVPR